MYNGVCMITILTLQIHYVKKIPLDIVFYIHYT